MGKEKRNITIVDKDDNVIGSMPMMQAIQEGKIRRVSRIFLIRDEEIYLQRRSPDCYTFPNTWDKSAGGHVDEGESYEQAARREAKEEIGIEDIDIELIDKFYFEEDLNGIPAFQFTSVFKAIYSDQHLNLAPHEVSSGRWFNFNDVDEMIKNNPNEFATGFLRSWERFKKN